MVLSIFIYRSIDIHGFSENHIFKNKVAKDPINTIYFLIQKYLMKSKKNWHSTSIDEATVYCKLTYYIELNELCILHVLAFVSIAR